MGKRKRKTKQIFPIKYFILIFLLFSFLTISLFLNFSIQDQKNVYSSLQSKIKDKKHEKYKINESYTNLQNEIQKYQNIESEIVNTKKSYFSKIKELEDKILHGESPYKIAYLTFDDGPYYNTYRVLDILDEYGVKATFFTISMNGEYCFDNKSVRCFPLYHEYEARGHTIANHTYTHGIFNGLYSSVDSFMDAIIKQEEHIKNYTNGYVTNIVRFPGGSSTAKGLKEPIIEQLRKRGYGWVDWNALDGDGKKLDSYEQAWNIFTSSINENIEVVLFHDYNSITTALLPQAITYLQENNYVILPLFYESNVVNK